MFTPRLTHLTHLTHLAFLLLPLAITLGESAHLTFENDDRSGVARVDFDGERITAVTELAPNFPVTDAFKLIRLGDRLVVAASVDDQPGVVIYNLSDPSASPDFVKLDGEVSEIKPAGDRALIATSRGRFVLLDPLLPADLEIWNARKALTPPGRKGEDVLVLSNGQTAIASFQKDDDDSDATGSRLVILGLDPLAHRHDLQLPRDHPDLHIEGNPSEQGPNPEKLFAFPDSNTLAITLDLYGAVAFTDLDAALDGRLENYTAVPSADDDRWGVAFPDRGLGFAHGGRDWLLVTNASPDGGLALFDVAARSRVHVFPASAGAETPVLIPTLDTIATVVSGKVKSRTPDGLLKDSRPDTRFLLLDLDAPFDDALRTIPLDGKTSGLLATENPNRILVFTTAPPSACLFEVGDRRVLSTASIPGEVIRATR